MELREIALRGNWKPAELRELQNVFRPLPRAWVENNPSFRTLAREAVLTGAPPDAPGHSKYEPQLGTIVVYDKGVYHDGKLDREQFRRSIYHELAHSIIRSSPQLLKAWNASTGRDGFVDEYAKTSDAEDFADTLSEFLIHNAATRGVVPKKAAFLQNLLDEAEEKVAMVFLQAFADELTKTATGAGGLKKLLEIATRVGKSGGGKAALGLGAGGAIGATAGERHGEAEGYGKGTKDLVSVAQKARQIGRQEGIMMYHRRMMQRMRRQRT